MTKPTKNSPEPTSADLKVSDFDFHLPEDLIAQQPPAERGTSRMLIVQREAEPGQQVGLGFSPGNKASEETGASAPEPFLDSTFAALPSLLNSGDLLVLNDSRVIPARLYARRSNPRGKQEPTGQIEVLLTSPTAEGNWQALVRPGRKVRPGDKFAFYLEGAGAFRPLNPPPVPEGFSPGKPLLEAEVLSAGEFGARLLRFAPTEDFFAALDQIGHMPLPPYIHRDDQNTDRDRYQTVFAHQRGSVAAPTAGLHFTPEILAAIANRGVEIAKITLHVGLGTFAPLRVERLSQIHLHSERYTLSPETAAAINRARNEGRRIIAVGTTTVRTLEHCAAVTQTNDLQPHTGETSIFIAPGHYFRLVNAMLTNFHLPQSSLLMLVSAFTGPENGRARILAAYHHAVREKYRFFSYGDCMLIV